MADSSQSAQRESNPHVRHGKAAGIRYIMGAFIRVELSKNELQSTGWDSNPRRRITGAESSPLDHQCILSGTGGARTLTCPVKSRMCCR